MLEMIDMRCYEVAGLPAGIWSRDPLSNEAQLTVHVEDEPALSTLLWDREDTEIVERGVSVMPNSTLVYVRCEDEDVAAKIEAAWAPYHPSRRASRIARDQHRNT